jgi:hypothetical protein
MHRNSLLRAQVDRTKDAGGVLLSASPHRPRHPSVMRSPVALPPSSGMESAHATPLQRNAATQSAAIRRSSAATERGLGYASRYRTRAPDPQSAAGRDRRTYDAVGFISRPSGTEVRPPLRHTRRLIVDGIAAGSICFIDSRSMACIVERQGSH